MTKLFQFAKFICSKCSIQKKRHEAPQPKYLSKEEYIKQCGCTTSKDLSENQILSYFMAGNGGIENMMSASMIKRGRMYGADIDRAKAIAMLRQAFDLEKTLRICYIDAEGVVGENESISGGYFEMMFRDGQTPFTNTL